MNRTPDPTPPRLTLDRVSALGPPGSSQLVRDVSFGLAPGSCLALLDQENDGAGLLLDLVIGHRRQGSGTIRLDGRRIDALAPEARGIGMVSARDPLFAHLPVSGNVAFPLRARQMDVGRMDVGRIGGGRMGVGERHRRLHDALALLGLEPVAHLRPAALSAGDRVRAALARALVSEPALLLLDAPFASLTPLVRAGLQHALRRLIRARGLSVLLATADRDEALLLGDEIGVLASGVLHQVGTAQALLDRPRDAVVAARIGDANLLPGRIARPDEEAALVRLASGHVMEAAPTGPLAEGDACMLCVRPDRIAIAVLSRRQDAEPAMARDALPAVLQEAIHFGDHLRLRFRLEDGTELLVRRPPAAQAGELRPGRNALLAWQAHHASVFPA